jgi:protein TonB
VVSQRIVKSSGHADLDQEVLALVRRAQPLPPFPPAMTQSVIHLSVPIRFSLR